MYDFYPFSVVPLQYPYNALEPHIDERTMHFHHDKHYQTYVDKLNKILEANPSLHRYDLECLIIKANSLPQHISTDIKNNAGGVYNHKLYFASMTPNKTQPSDFLLEKINHDFCSFDSFKTTFKEAALAQFGSGYAWLVFANTCLKIIKTANQDTPLLTRNQPLLLVDIWEHAYYLKYQNRRDEYFENWFKIINWDEVEERYILALNNRC